MLLILKYFWQICLLQTGPHNIPSSRALTITLSAGYAALSIISLWVIKPEIGLVDYLIAISAELSLEAAFLFGLLYFKNVPERFLSVFAALLAANTILSIFILPLNVTLTNLSDGILADFFEAISIVVFFWWLSIVGFILNKSSNISMTQGVMLAFILEFLVVILTKSLLPDFY